MPYVPFSILLCGCQTSGSVGGHGIVPPTLEREWRWCRHHSGQDLSAPGVGANDAEPASFPPLKAWYLLCPGGPGGQTSPVFQEVVPLHPGLTELCPEAWQPKHSSFSKRKLPLSKSLFCLHGGAGSCPSRPQLPHGGDP